jgi:hypothetical protein
MHCEAFGQRVGTIGRCLECSISSTLPGCCISYYENMLRLLHKLESICSEMKCINPGFRHTEITSLPIFKS